MGEESCVLEQQLRDSVIKQQELQKNKDEIERKLNDDLRKQQTVKESLLTRYVQASGELARFIFQRLFLMKTQVMKIFQNRRYLAEILSILPTPPIHNDNLRTNVPLISAIIHF